MQRLVQTGIRTAAVGSRSMSTAAVRVAAASSKSTNTQKALYVGGTALTGTMLFLTSSVQASEKSVDYDAVRRSIAEVIDDDSHDDGSFGPIFVRLAWHAAGTYDKKTGTGGPTTGASMRFPDESEWGANAGLGKARDRLEAVKAKHPEISYADLWSLAGVVAVEEMGGPKIEWAPGRKDCTEETKPNIPDGRLPDAAQGPPHLRDIFYRMGFSDQEIVALSGAHTLGRCHETSSGFTGPWTNAPTTFSNLYFTELLDEGKWSRKKWSGPTQYEDPQGLMMLPTDMCLLDDPSFRPFVEMYAKDEEKFFKDFSSAYSKLLSLGMACKPWYQFW